MKKLIQRLFFAAIIVSLAGAVALADEPQQSKTGPTPSLKVLQRDLEGEFLLLGVPPISPVVIPGVPNYLWRHGCGPTAVGHVVGYYDTHGYNDLIIGDANSQTNDVNQAMASGGDANNPNPPGSEQHYEDYSRPEDSPPNPLPDDYITMGRVPHPDDCIGDYQRTSQSNHPLGHNYYGWSWSTDIGPSFVGYVNQQNASYSPTYQEYSSVSGSALTWNVLTNEIDNNRPMVFLVDSDGDGDADHFVVVVGYDTQTNQYGCHDSWDNTKVRWETFQGIASGQQWGIWGGWSFQLNQIKWEQLPDTTYYGIDIRCDISDGIQRTLADDFECTTTGPITEVTLWGSWRSDIKGRIQKIHLSIHSDDPVGPGGSDPCNTYSKPDLLLWQQDFTAADFVETLYTSYEPEWWWDPTTDMPPLPNEHYGIWQYDISINSNQFIQQGDPCSPVIYWLDVYVDLVQGPNMPEFGWKTSIDHWNDDAVFQDVTGMWQELRYPPEHPMFPDSIDLSFRIITETEEPNEPTVKYIQLPDLTPDGMDIRIDDSDGVTRHIADDFPCTTTGLITDVHFWGSWKYDEKGPINGIVVSIYSDDPVGPGGSDPNNQYSMPDLLLWQQQFLPGQFTETLFYDLTPEYEWWWDPYYNVLLPNGDHQVWKYDININQATAFRQQGDPCNPVIYWLALEVWLPYQGGYEFGWKTSEKHWNDDAVFATGSIPPYVWNELRYPPAHPLYPDSIDMAFAITTEVNEPNDTTTKYIQRPDLTETGVDVDATFDITGTSQWQNQILADDFPCIRQGPITDIHLWSSWYHDEPPMGDPNNVEFTLSIHKDIPVGDPCNPNDFSIPGEMIWVRHFLPGEFRASIEMSGIPEGYYVPCEPYYEFPGDYTCWRYDFYIDPLEAFLQQGDPNNPLVYWLDVQARVPSEGYARFGWKSSLEHWNDDAVFAVGDELNHTPWQELRYPIDHQYYGESMDLAFRITTDPNIEVIDCGDAPDTYPTLLASGGPSHVATGPMLGAVRDIELDGQPSTWCDLDDITALDDEDGVTLINAKNPNGSVTVTVSAPCLLDAWMDFNGDGDFADAGEQIFASQAVVAGANLLTFPVPAVAKQSLLVSRWRVSTAGGLSYGGPAPDGEVEDYITECLDPADPGYTAWISATWNRPRCWCFRRQCRGDINGAKAGPFWVQVVDLNIFKQAFNKTDAQLAAVLNGICADLNHLKAGPFRVNVADLNIFKQYFNKPEAQVPPCDSAPIITGPYNFWTNSPN